MSPLVEACVDSVDVAIAAEQAGASRIELNFALALDGLTPSPGLVHSVVEAVSIPVIAMVRPRAGDFVYSDREWEVMGKDVTWLLDQGVQGIAVGALRTDGTIDVPRCEEIRQRTEGAELVFHRAFDEVDDWQSALRQLMDCGVDRILTSGQQSTAIAGIGELAKMVEIASGRLTILPGAGINRDNVREIIERTGCTEVHGSFSRLGNRPDLVAEEIAAVLNSPPD